ncbi:MAG: iron-sulfur cluster assembly accessory protein [Acidobacteria bacterium]|nr:MAG: iron-sulfur cluster assembly accessory protein [Acidobacteriota bacterium]
MTSETGTAVLEITPPAMERILKVQEDSEKSGAALRVEIVGVAGGDFVYDMSFAPLDAAREDDTVFEKGELSVMVISDTAEKLKGSVLDLSDEPNGGLIIDNPNDVWDFIGGDLARRVHELLERQINPSIASHGGRADLVKVEGSVAHLRLGGGCQGCGMARVTLSEGIATAIQEEIPEIEEVIDVTDHGAGANPYY